MCIAPDGSLPYCNTCTGQRSGYDLCPSTEFTVNTIVDQVKKIFSVGVDYVQVLDQNMGGTSHFCYSKDHNHPPVPGKWQTDAMNNMIKKFIAVSKDKRLKDNALNNKHLLKWVGELYLELHRGTYTSIAKNKRKNRKGEFLLQNVELLSAMNMNLNQSEYKQNEINDAWEILLTNQLHDIIPGSSIKEVYDESDVSYAKMFDKCNNIFQQNISIIKNNINTDGGIFSIQL